MEELSFEDAIHQLNTIIKSFSQSDLKLDEAIKNYEEGTKLYLYCENLLKTATNRFDEINIHLKSAE
jgi:exodeoxyribonuclease VII small subunit